MKKVQQQTSKQKAIIQNTEMMMIEQMKQEKKFLINSIKSYHHTNVIEMLSLPFLYLQLHQMQFMVQILVQLQTGEKLVFLSLQGQIQCTEEIKMAQSHHLTQQQNLIGQTAVEMVSQIHSQLFLMLQDKQKMNVLKIQLT